MNYNAPLPNQIEINLFGGGNAYGETVLIHLGFNTWIVVDSILNPYSNIPVVLEYFESIGENPSNIKLIIATHWHDDHIKGIHDIYTKSGSDFVISEALSKPYLAKLITLDEYKQSQNSGLKEFGKIISTSYSRKNTLKKAVQDRVLYSSVVNNTTIKVTALSPSDRAIELFQQEMTGIINEAYNLNLTFKKNNQNHSSIVILVEVGTTKILLGGDLEVTSDFKTGWHQVCNSILSPKDKSVEIFKIPHHGSVNGHHDNVWETIICDDHVAILTPYGFGKKKLPSADDKARLLEHSNESYITSTDLTLKKSKKKDTTVNRIIKEFNYNIFEKKFDFGQIQLRRDIDADVGVKFEVVLYGEASKLADLVHE